MFWGQLGLLKAKPPSSSTNSSLSEVQPQLWWVISSKLFVLYLSSGHLSIRSTLARKPSTYSLTHTYIYIFMGIVWLRALCSVWELVIEFIELVHVCKKSCTFHRSCARFTEVVHVPHATLITFLFNCCGVDGSHWGLLTRLSRGK